MDIKTIIFDAGGVLHADSHIDLPHQHELQQLSGMRPDELHVYQNHDALNRGEVSLLQVFQAISKHSFTNCTPEQLLNAYQRGIILDKKSVELARCLRHAGYKLVILSNNSDIGIQHTRALLKDLDLFSSDGIYGSSEIKISKPDPKIFTYLCEKEKVMPQTCLFIDDRDENLLAASQLGMQIIKFVSDTQCMEALLSKEILNTPCREVGLIRA